MPAQANSRWSLQSRSKTAALRPEIRVAYRDCVPTDPHIAPKRALSAYSWRMNQSGVRRASYTSCLPKQTPVGAFSLAFDALSHSAAQLHGDQVPAYIHGDQACCQADFEPAALIGQEGVDTICLVASSKHD